MQRTQRVIDVTIICVVCLWFYSQSLFTLSLIEKYLSKMKVPWPEGNEEKWAKNKNYYSQYSTVNIVFEKYFDIKNIGK